MSAIIEIIEFRDDLAQQFKELNVAWLKKYFYVEPIDEEMLSNPRAYFIDKGGHIFFATVNGEVAGTFALMKVDEASYELSKMAVDESFQGNKVGNHMLAFCLNKAADLGAKKVILYSNTLLGPAIHLYRKYGFVEVPLGNVDYERANIKMERDLTPNASPKREGKEKEYFKVSSPVLFKYARDNRKRSTMPEEVLWSCLRNRKLEGLKFRRQHPIGEFITDFYCHEIGLVIELDGAVHNSKEAKEYDRARELYLIDLGFKVIRFKNDEIKKELNSVLEKIKSIVKL